MFDEQALHGSNLVICSLIVNNASFSEFSSQRISFGYGVINFAKILFVIIIHVNLFLLFEFKVLPIPISGHCHERVISYGFNDRAKHILQSDECFFDF